MKDSDNPGRIFEQRIFQYIKQLNNIDAVYDEDDLRRLFGWESVGIDFLIVKGSTMIVIQTKYRKTRRREDHGINNFVKSIDHVLRATNKRVDECKGFWISRRKPFDDNIGILKDRNIRCIHEFDCMDNLVTKATSEISVILG